MQHPRPQFISGSLATWGTEPRNRAVLEGKPALDEGERSTGEQLIPTTEQAEDAVRQLTKSATLRLRTADLEVPRPSRAP